MSPQVDLPLYVLEMEGLLYGKYGYLQPLLRGFAAIDLLLRKENLEILLLLPEIEHKKVVEEWLIATHKPMLTYLTAGFIIVSNTIPRQPEAYLGRNMVPFIDWPTALTEVWTEN